MPANLLLKMTPLADWLCSKINSRTSFHPTCTLTSSLLVLSPHPHCILSASQNPCLSVLVIKFIGPINPEVLESHVHRSVWLWASHWPSQCFVPHLWDGDEDAVSDGQWVWGAARALVTQSAQQVLKALVPAWPLLLCFFCMGSPVPWVSLMIIPVKSPPWNCSVNTYPGPFPFQGSARNLLWEIRQNRNHFQCRL